MQPDPYPTPRDMPRDLRDALIASHICLNCKRHVTNHCERCRACADEHFCPSN